MKRSIVVGLLMICVLGCEQQPAALRTVPMTIGSKTYTVEVADTEAIREHGLMDRDAMADDHGMIFVFEDNEVRGFWMHHCKIPLDIVFIDPDGVVVATATMQANDENTTSSIEPAMYAVELSKGQIAADGIKVGDKVKIPDTRKPTTAPTTAPPTRL